MQQSSTGRDSNQGLLHYVACTLTTRLPACLKMFSCTDRHHEAIYLFFYNPNLKKDGTRPLQQFHVCPCSNILHTIMCFTKWYTLPHPNEAFNDASFHTRSWHSHLLLTRSPAECLQRFPGVYGAFQSFVIFLLTMSLLVWNLLQRWDLE